MSDYENPPAAFAVAGWTDPALRAREATEADIERLQAENAELRARINETSARGSVTEAMHVQRVNDIARLEARALEYGNQCETLQHNLAEALRLLKEARQPVREREFLENHEYAEGSGAPFPSPGEWGIAVQYIEAADAKPFELFDRDVDRHHATNRDEDEDGEYLTLGNRIDAFLAKRKEGE